MHFIASQDAFITWNEDEVGKVTGVQVKSRLTSHTMEGGAFSTGCVYADWETGPDGRTPMGAFVDLTVFGFASEAECMRALQEFGKIDVCEWARIMASALEGVND